MARIRVFYTDGPANLQGDDLDTDFAGGIPDTLYAYTHPEEWAGQRPAIPWEAPVKDPLLNRRWVTFRLARKGDGEPVRLPDGSYAYSRVADSLEGDQI
jgi:hypothetical protein